MAQELPSRITAGISITDAADYIRNKAKEWGHAPKKASTSGRPCESKPELEKRLADDVRDAGWCVYHAYGMDGMRECFDLALEGLREHRDLFYDLYQLINERWAGIGTWMP